MSQVTTQAIFKAGFKPYEKTRNLPFYLHKAARAIMQCRMAVLGGHIQGCPDQHYIRVWYNSCKHRLCPQCAFLQIENWLMKQKARLLRCDHYHAIFTIPHEFNDIWLYNTKFMTSLLFNAVRDTLFDLLGDDKYLGAEPGLIAALHTWGQTLILHPHIHCLITGGGLTKSGQWLPVINNYLLPSRVVMALFRKKFTYAMHKAFLKGKIKLPPNMRPQQFLNLLNKLRHKKLKKWNVRILAPYLHGAGVVTYLARYMRGGPIKNSRIIYFDGEEVKFQYFNNHVKDKNGNGKKAVMKLSTEEFIDRLLQHAPQPGTQVVRFYGLYHHSKSEKLDLLREQMGQPPYEEPEKITWREYCSERGDDHPERCPECGKKLVILYSTEGKRIPIPERIIRNFQAGGAPPRQYLEKAA